MQPLTKYQTIQITPTMSGGSVEASMAARTGLTPRKPCPYAPRVIVMAASQYNAAAIARFTLPSVMRD